MHYILQLLMIEFLFQNSSALTYFNELIYLLVAEIHLLFQKSNEFRFFHFVFLFVFFQYLLKLSLTHNNNKLYKQLHLSILMQERDYFFKPYRERIHDMKQQHDSLEQSPQQTQQYHPFFGQQNDPNQFNYTRNPYSKHSPSKAGNKRMKEYDYNNNKKHTKLGRQMHQPIWQHLYNQGLRVQKQIQQQSHQKKFSIDPQCTFQPMIKKNARYRIPTSSNFLQRNYMWQQTKLEKIVKQKQEEVVKDLQNCTFKPKLNKYKVTSNKYHHLNPSKSLTTLRSKQQKKEQGSVSPLRNKEKDKERERERKNPDLNKQEVGKIKNLIRTQLKRIQL